MTRKRILSLVALMAVLGPSSSFAESKKKEADRELARQLAASLMLVASEGEAFAKARDGLAKARLQNIQNLEESLVLVQEENDLDVRAWKVVGETYRIQLLEGVLEATDEIAAQEAAKTERRRQHQIKLAATKSSVHLKKTQLLAAAESLAALAEPPAKNDAVSAMVKTTMAGFAKSLVDGNQKMKEGLALVQGAAAKIPPAGRVDPGE